MPFGAVLGVFTIIVLMRERVREMFAASQAGRRLETERTLFRNIAGQDSKIFFRPPSALWTILFSANAQNVAPHVKDASWGGVQLRKSNATVCDWSYFSQLGTGSLRNINEKDFPG